VRYSSGVPHAIVLDGRDATGRGRGGEEMRQMRKMRVKRVKRMEKMEKFTNMAETETQAFTCVPNST
jgi:hypothetical protein